MFPRHPSVLVICAAVLLLAAGCGWLAPVLVPDPIPAATLWPTVPPTRLPTTAPTRVPSPLPTPTARPPEPTPSPATLPATLTPPGPTPQGSPEPPDVLGSGVTITFWHSLEPASPAGGLLAAQIAEFEQIYPQVSVEATFVGSPALLHRAMLLAIAEEAWPDLAMSPPEALAEYVGKGAVAPLDDYLSDPELGLAAASWEDLLPGARRIGLLPQYGAQRYALPFALSATGLWYNQDLLEQAGRAAPPRTWAEFEDACLAVAASTGRVGYGYVPSGRLVTAWFTGRGVPLLSEAGDRAAFATPAGAEALALLARLRAAGAAREYATDTEAEQAFAEGHVALLIGSTGVTAELHRLIAGAEQGVAAWGQEPLPGEEGAGGATLLTGSALFSLRTDPLHETAAWLLIRFLGEPRQAAAWGRVGYLPVRTSAGAFLADQYARSPVLRQQVERLAPRAVPAPAFSCLGEVEDYLLEALLAVRDGSASSEEALARAASLADAALAVRCR